jgi:hypothetical protein
MQHVIVSMPNHPQRSSPPSTSTPTRNVVDRQCQRPGPFWPEFLQERPGVPEFQKSAKALAVVVTTYARRGAPMGVRGTWRRLLPIGRQGPYPLRRCLSHSAAQR